MQQKLNKTQIVDILNSNKNDILKDANNIRSLHKGNYVHLRGLLEFSNICKCNCKYCGLRSENKNITRYRLNEDEIIQSCKKAIAFGFKTLVLQSGEDNFFDIDKLCKIIKKLKEYDIAITLSIGERSYDEYKAMKKAGADRYLLRIETTDNKLYNELHPNMSHQNRFECLYNLKSLDFETGTGNLVGLPNQSIESLADDILFFKELNADMVGIGPFIPHPNTPLHDKQTDNFELSLKVMALTRILLPDINIPATTAMETMKKNGRIIALNSGANVIMLNVTNDIYKDKYEIYPNKYCSKSNIKESINELEKNLNSIGRNISQTKGYRKDNE